MMSFVSEGMFSLAEIADRADVPLERVRYVLDSGILQGGRRRKRETGASSPGRGIARKFTRDEAFGLVIVVLMLEGGLRRRAVQDCLQLFRTSMAPGSRRLRDVTLIRVLDDMAVVALEIGDGLNVRFVAKDVPAVVNTALPTHWIQPKTKLPLPDYDPQLVVRINLAKIRAQFR
jgi:hypothetical protein